MKNNIKVGSLIYAQAPGYFIVTGVDGETVKMERVALCGLRQPERVYKTECHVSMCSPVKQKHIDEHLQEVQNMHVYLTGLLHGQPSNSQA